MLAACQAGQPVKPFSGAADAAQISPEESRLWVQSRDADVQLRKSGALYPDAQLRAYVQSVMDRLYPEFRGTLNVRLVKTPVLNAFALPNGSIYVHLGMLARMENEAQLATVLAHEGAHFVHKHGLKQRRTVKGASAFAMGMAIAGVPIVGDVLAMSSIYGFSRELEREADEVAFRRLKDAGYATTEAAGTFELLLEEVKALDLDEPYFFSSHPKLQRRIENFRELAGSAPSGGRIAAAGYAQRVQHARIDSLKADLAMDRYQSVILLLEREGRRAHYPAHVDYYLGEAYRRRGEDGDAARAARAYQSAIAAGPDFAPSYRALGVYQMKQRQHAQARSNFVQFLELAPDSPRAGYVRKYLETLDKEGTKP